MTRVLLDTSAYSAFMRGNADVRDVLAGADRIAFSPVVLGELRAGFAAGGRARQNEHELASFMASPRVDVLSVTEETATFYAAIHASLRSAGTPIPTNDLWIAASAMQHGLHVLTADGQFRKVAQVITVCVEVGG